MQRWMAQWMELQQWIFPQPENLKRGGERRHRAGDVRAAGRASDGQAHVRPRRAGGEREAPFHTPVCQKHTRSGPLGAAGRTTFHFVNDGIETALDQAPEAAGDRDVRTAGGGATILAYERRPDRRVHDALSPVLFGSGIRLFEGVDAGRVALEPVRAEPTQRVPT